MSKANMAVKCMAHTVKPRAIPPPKSHLKRPVSSSVVVACSEKSNAT